MPKKSKKKGKRPSTSGDAPAKRGSAAPPPPPPAAPDDGPVFDDAFEDEYMEEDVVVGDEGEGEEHARRLIEADMEAETRSNTRVQDPRRNAKGGELDFDPRAYRMLHRLGSDWPCLSFDFVRDAGGGGRTRFPHALLAACGTQAVGDANRLTLLKLEGLGRLEQDSDEDESDDDGDDDDDRHADATADHVAFGHPGGVNRVAACERAPGLVATWSDRGAVLVWDARPECERLCAAGPRPAGVIQRGPLAVAQRPAEGFGLQWRDDACLACGANDGSVSALRLDPSGACAVDVEWAPAPGAVEDVAWSPTEATVLMTCGSAAGALRVLDARTASRAMLTRADAHGAADVNALSWNRSVAYLVATAGDDGCARVWDLRRFGAACEPVGRFDYHAGSHLAAVEWDPHDESSLCTCAGGAVEAVSLWDLSVEDDGQDAGAPDVPPQLLFVHQGMDDPKEAKYHPQIPGLVMTTAADGFSVFMPNI